MSNSFSSIPVFVTGFRVERAVEKLCKWALTSREEKLGFTHPETLQTAKSLAILYRARGRYDEAERLARNLIII